MHNRPPPPPAPPKPAGRRVRQEQRTIAAMLDIYCRDLHGTAGTLCADCARLGEYAHRRLDTCPFGEDKPACNQCEVHCYSAAMRERVREVMRYAGPRMPLRHPLMAIRHILAELRRVPALPKRRRGSGDTSRP